jgi:MraZ protein
VAVDAKKRLTIPARWRSAALEEIFILKSPNRHCLMALPQDVLEAMSEKAGSQAPTVSDHQTFKDIFFSKALGIPVDSQGRMVLTDDLCRFAGITKEAVLAGSGEKFDIWNSGAWSGHQQAVDATYTTMLKSLGL